MSLAAETTDLPSSDDAVLRKYDQRVEALAQTFFQVQREDLVQIGRIALLACIRHWRARSGHTAQFWTYAQKHVRGEMMRYVTREMARLKNLEPFDSEPADQTDWCESDLMSSRTYPAPDVVCEAREHFSKLKDREKQVVLAHISGEDLRSIAEELNVSKSVVHDILSAAMQKLRDRA